MPTPNRTVEREAFEAMLASEPWARVLARVQNELRRAERTCTTADTELEIWRAQGAVATARMFLALPAVILQELNQK